jgi:hypothetical protein
MLIKGIAEDKCKVKHSFKILISSVLADRITMATTQTELCVNVTIHKSRCLWLTILINVVLLPARKQNRLGNGDNGIVRLKSM